jgi:hypothetical protein
MAMIVSGEAFVNMLAPARAPAFCVGQLMAVPHSATASTATDRRLVDRRPELMTTSVKLTTGAVA